MVGWLLLFAGLAELVAASASRVPGLRGAWALAGAMTSLAGLLFIVQPDSKLIPVSYIVMAWLFLRGCILLGAAMRIRATRRQWLAFSGSADLALAAVLLLGLPVATLVTSMFGPTIELVASFALVLAISFLVTGAAFLGTASAERLEGG